MLCFMNGDIPRSQVHSYSFCLSIGLQTVCWWKLESFLFHSSLVSCRKSESNSYSLQSAWNHSTQDSNRHFLFQCYNWRENRKWNDYTRRSMSWCDWIPVPLYASPSWKVVQWSIIWPRIGFTKYNRLVATGGSSTNKEILQILSDIFQIPVFTIDCKDSAAIGAAIRAYRGYLCQETHQNVRMMIRVDDRFHLMRYSNEKE